MKKLGQIATAVLIKILSSILFVFVSLVAGYSFVTREFPPNFKKMWKAQSQFQALMNLKLMDPSGKNQSLGPVDFSELDVETLNQANQQRQKIAEKMMAVESSSISHQNTIKNSAEKDDQIQRLKQRVADLEVDVSHLKTQLENLKPNKSK